MIKTLIKKEQKNNISNYFSQRSGRLNPIASDLNLKQICLHVIIPVLLIITTIGVYSNIRGYEFVNYDDPGYVSENSYIQDGLTLKNIAWAFTTFSNSNWHPITWLSHMLDIDLFGLNAGYHHLINLFIHICNTLLLYLLFRKTTGDIYKSTVLAAFFALHPLHVESVAWIAERKDLLCGFFWISAMLAHYRYVQRPSFVRYLLTFFCFVLGSLSKPMMVTFPFALLLFDYWPLSRHRANNIAHPGPQENPWFRLILEKVPMIVGSIIISFVALIAQSKGGSMVDMQEIPLSIRIANAFVAYIVYIKKMIWPGDLSVLYPFSMPSLWLSVIGFISILGVLTLSFLLRQRHPYLLSGFLWYLGTLIPVIGIIQVGSQAMADRYTYIPSIGFFAAIIWGVSALLTRLTPNASFNKIILSAVTLIVLSLMMLLSSKQVRYWQNSITLMSNALAVTENNYIAHQNLGLALIDRGFHEEALLHFRRAIAIKPKFAEAYMNIGSYYLMRKEYGQAINFYRKTIFLNPSLVKAYALMGKALAASGKQDEAVWYFDKVHQLSPGNLSLRKLTEIEQKGGN